MEPLYFGPRRRLFGLRSEAQGEPRRTAIVVCHSWGVEYMRSYRALYLLAQQLAMRGFDTLRFDYSGTGDSADGERGITLAQWIEDIRCAARELQELSGADHVCLLGLRLGALLGMHAVAEGLRAQTVALWDAPDSGNEWIRELQELDRVHYARKNRYLPRELRLESLPGEMLGVPWPRALDEAVSGLSRRAPAGRATVLRLRSADVPPAVPEGEEIRLPDPGHWNDVTWLTRPWIPVNSQRTIVSELTERLA